MVFFYGPFPPPVVWVPMRIHVNGEEREVADNITLEQLLQELELKPRYLAVERNRELVPRTQHATCHLAPEDRLEIVTLVGGG